MASPENLHPFLFRNAFPYSDETLTITKALQKSLSSSSAVSDTADYDFNPFLYLADAAAPPTPPTPSTSIPPPPKRCRISPAAKVTKRKSRASKKSQTTFITADPANFRQMVQQVTGVRFSSNPQFPVVPVLKPEAQRPGNRLYGAGGCLPTLDTSAVLLDHHQEHLKEQQVVGSGRGPVVGPVDFDAFSSFPTLESWKVM
ncbi:calmodulin-binding protein 25 [Mercurialis annua]|uniref:calmodulin-binding protein 25 n=1 Tax=Mercurialis annua TaxID=3986 RepID=UPI0021602B3B|nr:calmodulin-binding protein 25 [Mercurialis annua]